jgi:hypothetical protein
MSAFVPFGNVSLRAIMVVGLRAVENVGLRAYVFCWFWNLPVQGRCCQNFQLILTYCLFCRTHGRDSAILIGFVAIAPLASLHRHPRYKSPPFPYPLSYLGRVIELGVSRPKGIHGRWYADQCISATVSLSDCPRFLDSPRIHVDGLASMFRSRPSRSFGSTSPLFSGYTLSPNRDVYRENSGEVLPKFHLRRERSMEANLIYASSGGIRTYPSPIRW